MFLKNERSFSTLLTAAFAWKNFKKSLNNNLETCTKSDTFLSVRQDVLLSFKTSVMVAYFKLMKPASR
jgi:hypothetical protein